MHGIAEHHIGLAKERVQSRQYQLDGSGLGIVFEIFYNSYGFGDITVRERTLQFKHIELPAHTDKSFNIVILDLPALTQVYN